MDINSVITILSAVRKIFVSEADFQFALAWQIQKQYPEAEIRLEHCPADIDKSMHVDILVKLNSEYIPIEVKYFKQGYDVVINGERFVLKNQGAQDISRYDFIKDITRIEKLLVADPKYVTGYAIALTNDPTYWSEPRSSNTFDSAFRIHEGSIKSGELAWAEHTGKGTTAGREEPLVLRDTYQAMWQDFSRIDESKAGSFKVLCLKVKPQINNGNNYWVYENWLAEKKAVIHKAQCSHCNNGNGVHKNVRGDKNGKGHGPFKLYDDARSCAQMLKNRTIQDCGHCRSRKSR